MNSSISESPISWHILRQAAVNGMCMLGGPSLSICCNALGPKGRTVLSCLQDIMKTDTGRRMAQHRHEVMESYLKEFYAEWDALA